MGRRAEGRGQWVKWEGNVVTPGLQVYINQPGEVWMRFRLEKAPRWVWQEPWPPQAVPGVGRAHA
ncbi:hypothetical protein E2C01_014618 [Portunus trituberculatus]|uniref:Uncharacterized protein n=1 Tax=Portunus trituberculatus TaxID=210409 RepID=A0A5B7DKK5_PORTR|nr:hypothetical protein [Portunus trituberculatus]